MSLEDEIRDAVKAAIETKALERAAAEHSRELAINSAEADDKVNQLCSKLIKGVLGEGYDPRVILYPGARKK